MPIIHINGRVFPEGMKVNTGRLGSVLWIEEGNASPVRFNINIASSIIDVECIVESYDPQDEKSLLLIRAFQFARSVVDCLAFISGSGLQIIFDSLVEPDGHIQNILFSNENLSSLSRTFRPLEMSGDRSFPAMFALVGSEPELFLALNDLIAAISMPGLVAINCARSLEGLRELLLPVDADDKRGLAWELLRHVLNLNRSYTDYITKASIAGRHGSKIAVPGEAETTIILERMWTIMDRFLAFRKGNSMPLSEIHYPILS